MEYLIHIGIIFTIYGILALSLNLVVGYTGLLSLAHAALYGIGAYTVAIFSTKLGIGFFPSVLAGMALSAIVALVIGLAVSRFRDDFYVLATLGMTVIVGNLFLNLQSVTRGPLGIPGINRPAIGSFVLSDNIYFLILSALCLLVVYVVARFIAASSFGRVLKAIREDEQALQVFGYKTHYFKLFIFMVAGALAALAGGLYASYITFIDPYTFSIAESILMISIIILGGLANNKGAILGALILVILPEALRFVGFPSDIVAQMRQVIYGLMLVLLMIYRPQGMIGEYKL
jgi:branched-chain amino acid transport system permease protein